METFDIYLFEQNFKDGQCVFETAESTISMIENDDCYIIQTEMASPDMVCTLKRFFPDTLELMEEGNYLKYGQTKIGVWKKYCQSSGEFEEIDYDNEWNMTWEKLIPHIQAQGIAMGGIVDIARLEEDHVWEIGQMCMNGDEQMFSFDGETGNLLETKRIPAPV